MHNMPICIVAVGGMKEKYYRDAAQEYMKRLSRLDKVIIHEVPDIPEPANASPAQLAQVMRQEGEKILTHIKQDDHVVALCIGGKQLDSEGLARKLQDLKDNSRRCVFVIGGSNGIGDNVLARADEQLSFSLMTFPHQLARVILLEQVFRACKINANERYHK